MTEWIAALAATGAASLVGAAATDAWKFAKAGFARLFAGVGRQQDIIEQRLDGLATDIESSDPVDRDEIRERLVPIWQARLSDLLEESPATSDDLQVLIEQLRMGLPAGQSVKVRAQATGAIRQEGAGPQVANTGVLIGNIDVRSRDMCWCGRSAVVQCVHCSKALCSVHLGAVDLSKAEMSLSDLHNQILARLVQMDAYGELIFCQTCQLERAMRYVAALPKYELPAVDRVGVDAILMRHYPDGSELYTPEQLDQFSQQLAERYMRDGALREQIARKVIQKARDGIVARLQIDGDSVDGSWEEWQILSDGEAVARRYRSRDGQRPYQVLQVAIPASARLLHAQQIAYRQGYAAVFSRPSLMT